MVNVQFNKQFTLAERCCVSVGNISIAVLEHLGRPKDIGIPNFDEIPQFTAEILLLPVPQKQPPY